MQALARGGFTAAQVGLALHAPWGSRQVDFRYDLLDHENTWKADITQSVLSATVTQNALDRIKRRATFRVRGGDGAINYLSDRIKPYVRIWVPPGRILRRWYYLLPWHVAQFSDQEEPAEGGWAEFPLGVFLLSSPERRADATGTVVREVEAYDQNQVLLDDSPASQYRIQQGTNFVGAVKTILDGAGITAQNLTATDKTLPVDREWDAGTPKLEVINDLLRALNYHEIYFDEDGRAIARPYVSPAQAPSEYTYRDDDQSVIAAPSVSQNIDLFDVPNRWVLVVSEPDRDAMRAVYTNANANSPTSTVSRGRTITRPPRKVEAPDQTTLDKLAARLAFEESQVYETISWESWLMPQHSHLDSYTFAFSALGVSAKFQEVGWEMVLEPGGAMRHEIRRIVQV